MLNIAAVVVWYNPSEEYVRNILSYSSFVKKVYIIDNSRSDNSVLAADIDNSVYVANLNNNGIAKALNDGCALAKNDGYEYVLTMDQDSHWSKEALENFLNLSEEYAEKGFASFSPSTNDPPSSSVLGDLKKKITAVFKRHQEAQEEPPVSEVPFVITSGNILSMQAWEAVGRFYEPLFIDEVDHEFCFRLGENGYRILRFRDAVMEHCLGEPKRQFYPADTHSGTRIYYIMRNGLYEKKLHPDCYRKYNYPKRLFRLVVGSMLNLRFNQFLYLIRAWSDARHDRLGKYEDLHP